MLYAALHPEVVRDAFLNVRIGQATDCVYIEADHAFNQNKPYAFSTIYRSCDEFTGADEALFQHAKELSFGGTVFSDSAYESSWFLGLYTGLNYREIGEFEAGSKSTVYSLTTQMLTGYQYHLKNGLIITAGYDLMYTKAFNYTNRKESTAHELDRIHQNDMINFIPFILLGWRF
jgi:hypothetical protein